MTVDASWLSSQVVVAAVVGAFAVAGAAFFFLSKPRQGAPPAGRAGTGDPAATGDGPRRDDGAAGADDATTRTEPAPAHSDEADPEAVASVFETDPCWVSLLPRRGAGSNAGRGGTDA